MPKNSFYQCTISYSLFIYRTHIDDVEVVINTTSEGVNRAAGCSYCLFVFEVSFIRLDAQFHFYWFSVLCELKDKKSDQHERLLFHLCHSAGSAFQCETQFPKKKREESIVCTKTKVLHYITLSKGKRYYIYIPMKIYESNVKVKSRRFQQLI